MNTKSTALVTGASAGIGAVYADRLAKRGHDLILVARNVERLRALAARIECDTGRNVEIIAADLNQKTDLARVEAVLRHNKRIGMLVNNAGIGAPQSLLGSDIDQLESMIDLNVTALTRLTYAGLPNLLGGGSVINIASVVGIAPEVLNGVYGGTKAFVIAFTRSLAQEFSGKGLRVQAVLPGATATEFWDTASTPLNDVPTEIVMNAGDMVDAAMAGYDQGEVITIPSLPDIADWNAYEAARQKMMPRLSLSKPAARYGLPAH